MARQTVLVGKIGPAFNGGEIRSYGGVTYPIASEVWSSAVPTEDKRYIRTHVLDVMCWEIGDNIESGAAYIEYSTDYAPRTMAEVIGILS